MWSDSAERLKKVLGKTERTGQQAETFQSVDFLQVTHVALATLTSSSIHPSPCILKLSSPLSFLSPNSLSFLSPLPLILLPLFPLPSPLSPLPPPPLSSPSPLSLLPLFPLPLPLLPSSPLPPSLLFPHVPCVNPDKAIQHKCYCPSQYISDGWPSFFRLYTHHLFKWKGG